MRKESCPFMEVLTPGELQNSARPKKVLACLAEGTEARSRPWVLLEAASEFRVSEPSSLIHVRAYGRAWLSWQAGDTTTFLLGRETCW